MQKTRIPHATGKFVSLTKDLWTSLGTGEMIITIHQSGGATQGHLKLNQAQTDASALIITKDRRGDQIANTSAADEIFAKATSAGWEVAVDI